MLRAASGSSKHVETFLSRPLHRQNVHSSSGSNRRNFHYSLPQLRTPSNALLVRATRNLASSSSTSAPRLRLFIGDSASAFRSRYSTVSGSRTKSVQTDGTEAETPQQPEKVSDASLHTEGVQEKFQRLGLNANITRQITLTHPNIRQPTSAQSALIPAILSPTDVIMRAHTGTGKSFGILLALLNKPRIVFRDLKPYAESSIASKNKHSKPQTGIASIILVPSNELAFQYLRWARTLFPVSSLPSLDPVIQCLVRGGLPGQEALTAEHEVTRLKATPPHILIGTPGRIKDILDTPAGTSLLGLDTLRTLVLDEADAVLQLPGRFPSHKQRWKHEVHKAPGLVVLNAIMKRRATFSGGEQHLSAGLENRPGKKGDERRPPEQVRRNTYQAAERSAANRTDSGTGLALPKARNAGVHPLQLIATSATANSVMRHFFGARTGWLRTGAKDSGLRFAPQVGRWIDLTGLSGRSLVDQGIRGLFGPNERSRSDSLINDSVSQTPSTMPASMVHTCVVVDEAPLSKQLAAVPLRNFETKLAKRKGDAQTAASADSTQPLEPAESELVSGEFLVVKPDNEPQEHEMDQTLIEALAFCFASEGVDRGLALIPARWSLLKTRAALEALGVTVRLASDVSVSVSSVPFAAQAGAHTTLSAATSPELFLLQTTSSRGLDIPDLSHVFLIGFASVIDAVQYVHSAGRVARIGGDPNASPTGKIVTLLRGLPHNTLLPEILQRDNAEHIRNKLTKAISTSEAKMANVYRRLGVVPKRFDLSLLTTGVATAVTQSQNAEPVSDASQSEASVTDASQSKASVADASQSEASVADADADAAKEEKHPTSSA